MLIVKKQQDNMTRTTKYFLFGLLYFNQAQRIAVTKSNVTDTLFNKSMGYYLRGLKLFKLNDSEAVATMFQN